MADKYDLYLRFINTQWLKWARMPSNTSGHSSTLLLCVRQMRKSLISVVVDIEYVKCERLIDDI